MTASTQTPGPDHAAKQQGFMASLKRFGGYARKAVLAFLASGVAGGLSDAIRNFDFAHLTWTNLWTGLVSGLVGSILVYVVRNRGTSVGIPPELEAALESIVVKHLGTFERNLAPKMLVRGEGGKLQKPPAAVGQAEPYAASVASPVRE